MDLLGSPSFLSKDPNWAVDFAPNGTRVGQGDIMTRKRYADLLELIAQRGADAFYTGDTAKSTITAVQAANGTMTLKDLSNYSVAIRSPVEIAYRGYKITSCGAPSSGTVALNALKTVEGYTNFGEPSAVNVSTHKLNEAIRFAYGAVSFPPARKTMRLTRDRITSGQN